MVVAEIIHPGVQNHSGRRLGCRAETPKVLLIEDHASLRRKLTRALEDSGCEVVSASCGVRGLLEFLLAEPDLIVLDLQLPDMEGLHFLGEVRARSREVPVLIMTTASAPVHSAIPSVSVIRKPFHPQQFRDEIERVLG
jgi:DNA-binding response OmpR family regulator